MKIGHNFMKLMNVLWETEAFNLWDSQELSTLAYLLDKLQDRNNHQIIYNQWMDYLVKNNYNEFAWDVTKRSFEEFITDERANIGQKENAENWIAIAKQFYENNSLLRFGIIPKEFSPAWFLEIYSTYTDLKSKERKQDIIDYCEKVSQMSSQRAESVYKKLYRHEDLLNEFHFFIRKGKFKQIEPIAIEGNGELITAQRLHQSTYLSPLGAYNFLIYLREYPQEALEDFKNGLPRK